ncbi:hypothetical protein J2Z21_008047 [Streptomyces griseochromogenes]|nr:hypothetical protein [Streptomyces griseochromogenes]MBP2055034.1 hypothetical protein [Streptomyces griseochromogenes]
MLRTSLFAHFACALVLGIVSSESRGRTRPRLSGRSATGFVRLIKAVISPPT